MRLEARKLIFGTFGQGSLGQVFGQAQKFRQNSLPMVPLRLIYRVIQADRLHQTDSHFPMIFSLGQHGAVPFLLRIEKQNLVANSPPN